MKDLYFMRNIREHDLIYLSANTVYHNVVDITILDYGKYIQVDRTFYRSKEIKRENTSVSKTRQ